MTRQVGIIGYPLKHSISPSFQQVAFDHYSLPVRYSAWSTHPDMLREQILKLRGDSYIGANVTVPHKENVRAHLDEIDPWATSIGAVNTIVNEDGRLTGYNTDASGFARSLKETGGFDPAGKRVLLLGAGGAARAAVFALANENVASLTIANRTVERAQRLADEVRGLIFHVAAVPLKPSHLSAAAASADLIVNSTSIGMSQGDSEDRSPLMARHIPRSALVYDMVYNPPETPLLLEAKRAGAPTLGGLAMLIYQGAAAFERWTGQEAPIDLMFRAGRDALAAYYAAG